MGVEPRLKRARLASRSLVTLGLVAIAVGAVACSTVQPDEAGGPSAHETTTANEVSLPPPDVRFDRLVDCVTRAGFAPVVDEELMTYELDYPPEQSEAVSEILQACRIEAFGFDPSATPIVLSEEQLGLLFDQLSASVSCIRDQGFDPPPRVSRESFIESQGAAWNPYLVGIPGVDITWDAWDSLIRKCPQPGF